MATLHTNGARLQERLQSMASFGALANGGCNRQALTAEDAAGRDCFVAWCQALGGQPRRDSMGNLFVRFAGSEPELLPLLLGSHLDTQPTGGHYDGVYGVLAALEVMHSLQEAGHQLRRSVELAVWTNEEGARFAPAMMGSGVFAGVFEQAELYQHCDREGISLLEALQHSGQLGSDPCTPFAFHAALELHIEQGPVLEQCGLPIGVVSGVQGMQWYEVTISGQSVHAGPTPMAMRTDPVQSLMSLLTELYALVADAGEDARLTVGSISTSTHATNTVPAQVRFTLDVRHPSQEVLERLCAGIEARCSLNRGMLQIAIRSLWRSPAVAFDANCQAAIAQACARLGLPQRTLVSGAGHDSVYLARLGPTGMIFIPCRDGLSHNELEYATPQHLQQGADVLLHTLLTLDQ